MRGKNNLLYLDLLRSWAMIIMIEVHIFNAFLQSGIREASWFTALNFINGMVAPSFIFISGFAFIISSRKNIYELRKFGALFRKKIVRIGQIFFVGYLVHIPYFSFKNNILYTDSGLLKSFYNVDVLQCIGAGVFLLFTARLLIKSDVIYNIFLIASAIGVVAISPFIWHTDFNRFLPFSMACYFNEVHGSYFPLFPWMGFLFSGAALAAFMLKAGESGKEDDFIREMMILGIIFVIISFPLVAWLKTFSWFEIKPSPAFFIQRLGGIFILLYLLHFYIKVRGEKESFFFDIGRESLLVYWLHLLIIYRILFNNRSIDNIVNKSFGVTGCTAATIAMIFLMVTIAVIWGRIKKYSPESARKIFISVIIAGLIFFCINY